MSLGWQLTLLGATVIRQLGPEEFQQTRDLDGCRLVDLLEIDAAVVMDELVTHSRHG